MFRPAPLLFVQPTAKARRELHPGLQTLTLRQRSVLLLAERRKPVPDLRRLFHGMGDQIVRDLLAQGYLAPLSERDARPADAPPAELDTV
jgi:hypothetical protein